MLTLNISKADIEYVKYERIQYPLAQIRVRFDALYLTSKGYSRHQVSEFTGLHRNTITKYIKTYNEGSLEQLKVVRWKGPKSCLIGQEQNLEDYFRTHPPHTVKQARAAIIQLCGETLSRQQYGAFCTN